MAGRPEETERRPSLAHRHRWRRHEPCRSSAAGYRRRGSPRRRSSPANRTTESTSDRQATTAISNRSSGTLAAVWTTSGTSPSGPSMDVSNLEPVPPAMRKRSPAPDAMTMQPSFMQVPSNSYPSPQYLPKNERWGRHTPTVHTSRHFRNWVRGLPSPQETHSNSA